MINTNITDKFTKNSVVSEFFQHIDNLLLFTVMDSLVSLFSCRLLLTTALLLGQPTAGHLQMGFCLRRTSVSCACRTLGH